MKQNRYGYIDILNTHLAEKLHPVQMKKDCNRIEGQLGRVCGEVVNKFVGKNGSSYRKLMVEQREIKIGVRADEIISISELDKMYKLGNHHSCNGCKPLQS